MEHKILTYSPSPHIKSPLTTRKIMINVCIALIPACLMGIVYFGLKALLILALASISAVALRAACADAVSVLYSAAASA